MKFVNLNDESDSRRSAVNRRLSSLVPSAARAAQESQDAVVQTFKRILDNRFYLFQGLPFEGLEAPTPLLLIGPAGVWLIEASPLSGIFRVVQSKMEEMDPKAHTFRPARFNVIAKTVDAVAAMQAALDQTSETLPEVEGAILFTHPGAHIEAQQPAIRLIQADAIARFAAGLLQIRPVIEPETVQRLADRLNAPEPVQAVEPVEPLPPEPKPAAPLQPPRLAGIPEEEPELIKRISNRLSFSRYQWSVIALLVFLNLLVLIAVIVIILVIT